MTQTEMSKTEEMKRYLFHEASETERERLEQRFFGSDEFFFELIDLENDLTDRYARGALETADRVRFERSLPKAPERREKLANAAALQKFFAEEKQTTTVSAGAKIGEKHSVGQSVANFFNFRMPVLQLASAALVVLLAVGAGFLLFERARINQELAQMRAGSGENARANEFEQREKSLREEITQAREREQNLQNQITDERGQSDILDNQLERERREKLRLESELETLKREKAKLPDKPKEVEPPAPVVATIFLSPISGKGIVSGAKTIQLSKNTREISATLQIPKESTATNFSVKLEGAALAENLKPQKTAQGSRFISIAIDTQRITPEKENLLIVTGDDDSRYNYVFRAQK